MRTLRSKFSCIVHWYLFTVYWYFPCFVVGVGLKCVYVIKSHSLCFWLMVSTCSLSECKLYGGFVSQFELHVYRDSSIQIVILIKLLKKKTKYLYQTLLGSLANFSSKQDLIFISCIRTNFQLKLI